MLEVWGDCKKVTLNCMKRHVGNVVCVLENDGEIEMRRINTYTF